VLRVPRPTRSLALSLIVPAVVLVGCSSASTGAASAVVTYTDGTGEQRVTVSATATTCDDEHPRRLASEDDAIAFLVDDEGAGNFQVWLDDELSFLGQAPASATDTGVTVSDVAGIIVRTSVSGMQTNVSEQATFSGEVVCPG